MSGDCFKINILITAGPTREYIDPVRYISNDSSGEMGLALVEEAAKLKARVTLIHGPITRVPPLQTAGGQAKGAVPAGRQVGRLFVVSAKEMFSAVKKCYKSADVIICAAAVADFRPVKYSMRKLKKCTPKRTIALVPNPDILAWLGNHKLNKQILVGFALETENLLKNAQNKLKNKKCDIIVGNYSKNIGKRTGSAVILAKNGYKKHIKNASKKVIAKAILTTICQKMQSC